MKEMEHRSIMKISSLAKYALSLTAAAGILAGCASGGSSAFSPASSSTLTSARHEPGGFTHLSVFRAAELTMPHFVNRGQHVDHSKSHMDPEAAKKTSLLYVSDWNTNDVYVYNAKTGASVGTLTGFSEPYGQCVDSKGDVFITNFGSSSVVEYAHGGSSPIHTFSTDAEPLGCAVDKAGDLAVDDFAGNPTTGYGDLAVFAGGGGTPTYYTSSSCALMWGPAYDSKGNLFVEGEYSTTDTCELPSGGSSVVTLSGPTIYFPGSPVWDGKGIALTDQEATGTFLTGLYQVTLSGTTLTKTGETDLSDTCYSSYVDVVVPFIVGKKNTPANKKQGKSVIGGNLWCNDGSKGGEVATWKYTAGGTPSKTLPGASALYPYGASISIGK